MSQMVGKRLRFMGVLLQEVESSGILRGVVG